MSYDLSRTGNTPPIPRPAVQQPQARQAFGHYSKLSVYPAVSAACVPGAHPGPAYPEGAATTALYPYGQQQTGGYTAPGYPPAGGHRQAASQPQECQVPAQAATENRGARVRNGWTDLHTAAIQGGLKEVRALTEAGSDLEAKCNNEMTVLHWAAALGNLRVVKALVRAGSDRKSTDALGRTPLMMAVIKDRVNIVQVLAEKRADREAKDDKGRTPLYFSAQNGYAEVAKALVNLGAHTEKEDVLGRTAIELAKRQEVKDAINAGKRKREEPEAQTQQPQREIKRQGA